jgi:dihydroneopterin aldolase
MNVVRLKNITLYGYHGAHDSERELGQRLELDVAFKADFSKAVRTDHVSDTVDYEKVYGVVESEVVNERYCLLESLACKIAHRLVDEFDILEATVRIRKPSVPIAASLDCVEVEVTKRRD